MAVLPSMLSAFTRALAQLPARELRRPLLLTLAWTLAVFALLWLSGLVAFERLRGAWSLETSVGALAAVAVAAVASWLLFVTVENAILFCYADRIAAAVERRYYPELPPASSTRWRDAMVSGLRLQAMTVIGNLLALPFYLLVPGLNLVLFLTLNGYLLGRTYFDAVALRRMEDSNARRVWRAHCLGFVANGALVAALLTVPVLNLVVPIVGLATAVHLFEQLRPRGTESS
jgi:uncharacterized protein involved in cysteine biosynthesis